MDKTTIQKRIKTVRKTLKKRRIHFMLITKPANVTYVTGFSGHDSWAAITDKQVYLITDNRYVEQAEKQCPACKIIERTGSFDDTVGQLVSKLRTVRSVAVDNSISVADFDSLRKQVKARFRTVSNIIEPARRIKDQGELAHIRTSIRIAAKSLRSALKQAKTGITENALAGLLEYEFRKNGGIEGFDTIVAFGANGSEPHHQPGQRKLKKNDTILIDFGASYGNYRCDVTRCFVVGKHTAAYEEAYEVVRKAQAAAIAAIAPGASAREIDAAARKVIDESGLPVYKHGSGHGFGLEIHEQPGLSTKSKDKLEVGTVITIEPGIYIPGKLGIRMEDDVLVTKTGHKLLTGVFPRSFESAILRH